MLGLGFAPRLLGVLDVLLRPDERRRWGGTGRLLAGAAAADGAFTIMIGPVMMVAQARFIGGLLFGRRVIWEAQQRDGQALPVREALRGALAATAVRGRPSGLVLLRVAPGAFALGRPLRWRAACLPVPFRLRDRRTEDSAAG